MNTKHASGPWTSREQSGHQFIVESTEGSIAWLDRHYSATKEQGMANARLIAAAPELLEALLKAGQQLEGRIRDEYEGTPELEDQLSTIAWIPKLIAKATL